LGTKTILLVEDDSDEVRLIQRAFTKAGIEDPVYRLSNGDEVISYLDADSPFDNRLSYPFPSLMLLDIKLPRRSGHEVLQWVRSRKDERRRLPIIMLTSSRHSVDVNRAYELGANSYITKPDSSDELLRVAEYLRDYWLHLNEYPELGSALS
jgi:DNA-binding response OmpR family regulator